MENRPESHAAQAPEPNLDPSSSLPTAFVFLSDLIVLTAAAAGFYAVDRHDEARLTEAREILAGPTVPDLLESIERATATITAATP
jgi:hypothetical protein